MFRQERQHLGQRQRGDGCTGSKQQRGDEADEGFELAVDAGRAHRAPQQGGNDQTFAGDGGQGDETDAPVEFMLHEDWHRAQYDPLSRHGANEVRQTAAAEREEIEPHR